MRNAGLEQAQAGIKIAGRNINNLRYADDTTLITESEEKLKSLLMKVKEESEKVGFRSDQSLSRVRLLVTPWTEAHQAPPSMGFSRQEYRSGVPLPSPEFKHRLCLFKRTYNPGKSNIIIMQSASFYVLSLHFFFFCLRYADDTTFMAQSEEELKSLLIKVKEESEKAGLKLNLQKMKIMASGPITSWEIDGETVETVSDFIFGGSKIIADGDCSHEIKRRLLLGRKVMTNLDSIFKSRDITLPTKVHLVKAMVFPLVMYGCESWNVKKAERRRIDALGL